MDDGDENDKENGELSKVDSPGEKIDGREERGDEEFNDSGVVEGEENVTDGEDDDTEEDGTEVDEKWMGFELSVNEDSKLELIANSRNDPTWSSNKRWMGDGG